MLKKLLVLCLFNLIPIQAIIRYSERTNPNPIDTITAFQVNATIFSGIGGTSASDLVNIYTGTQSNRLSVAATTVLFQETISPAKNICADSTFGVTFYMKNKANTTNNNVFQLYIGTNTSNYWTYDFAFAARDTNITYYGNGFVTYTIIKRKMTVVGSPTCSNTGVVIIGLKGQTATVDTVTLGAVIGYTTRLTKGIVILTIDDQWKSFADSGGFHEFDTRGYPYGMFINNDLLGAANKLNKASIDSIHALFPNVDIYPHFPLHDTLNTLTADSITRGLARGYNFCNNNGYKGCSIFAVPFGSVSQNRMVDSVIRFCGYIDFCRLTLGNTLGEAPNYYNKYAVRAIFGLGNAITEAQAEAVINDVILSKTVGIIYGHKLGLTAIDGNTWAAGDWRTFCAFLQTKVDAGLLSIMSWTQFLQATGSQSRTIGHRVFRRR